MLLRKPRVPGKNRLVDWQLVLQAYGLVGFLETAASFAMSYWYLQRKGIPFSDIWFSFGKLPDTIDPDYYQARLNEASSIYFVNLVVMLVAPPRSGTHLGPPTFADTLQAMVQSSGRADPASIHLPAPSPVQQEHPELVSVPSHVVCSRHGLLLAVPAPVPERLGYGRGACRTLVPAHGVWHRSHSS